MLNLYELEPELKLLTEQPFEDGSDFIIKFLEIYNIPQKTITDIQKSYQLNVSVFIPKKLAFIAINHDDLLLAEDQLKEKYSKHKNKPRLYVVTNGKTIRAWNAKQDQSLDIRFAELNDYFDFFAYLAGIERYEIEQENIADIKATGRINKLYTALLDENMDWINNPKAEHELNLFVMRLLFCFFAEDTAIFSNNLFTQTVMTLSSPDGSDTADILHQLFEGMATSPTQRQTKNFPKWVLDFPYVNGGLFNDEIRIPRFSDRALRFFSDCGNYDWKEINPDIFGSMMQAIANKELRKDNGMHYTSVPNINRLLDPLLFNQLNTELTEAGDDLSKLNKFHDHLARIRIFDPACGSGNFLIIAYRRLRELEFEVLKKLKQQIAAPLGFTSIQLDHFYGIELDDFAVQTARLSLWIAQYQMNAKMKKDFGDSPATLPLTENGHIICGNALRLDWTEICPVKDIDPKTEVYVAGNPPFHGGKRQSKEQKEDIKQLFSSYIKKYKDLDYSAGWFLKTAQFLIYSTVYNAALVSTNSICQGTQVELLWPLILALNIEIGFAWPSFKWKNNATHNAGVTCIIVGLRRISSTTKTLYFENYSSDVSHISPYLLPINNDIIMQKRSKPLGNVKSIILGNMAVDGGNLILSPQERQELLDAYPHGDFLIKRTYGSQEFIRGEERYCLWIHDQDLSLALSIPPIKKRIEAVRQKRLQSSDSGANKMAERPHQFREMNEIKNYAFLIPLVSSEQRQYLTVGYISKNTIINANAFSIFDPPDYLFAILSSRLHAVWLASVGGKFEERYRYSNTIVYNNFPFLPLTLDQEEQLGECAGNILAAREEHPGKTIATLYNPQTMPTNLLQAHQQTDALLETFYNGKPFVDDTERLTFLFKQYERLLKADTKKKAVKKQTKKKPSKSASNPATK